MPKIHFSYTVPLGKTVMRRAFDKAIRLSGVIPPYRFGYEWTVPWQKPIRAPHCISYHLLQRFMSEGQVRFYNMLEHTVAKLGVDDIFIGQPVPDGGFGLVRSQTDDRQSITSRTIRAYPNHRVFLIMPYTHDPFYVSWAKDLLADFNGGLILIGGKIWERDWLERSPFADLPIKRKVHVEMGIDADDYPVVKTRFNSPTRRKFLYIGHTGWYKNTKELENIAAKMPNYEFAHIGGGEIVGWKKLANFASLTPEYMAKISAEYDIFVNTSTADAQATTILESMCFGFVVAATYESGYDHPSIVRLSPTDTAFNLATLVKLQQAPESELLALAKANRQIAIEHHSWERFVDTVWHFINN